MIGLFTAFVSISDTSVAKLENWQIWLILGAVFGIYLALYLLRSIGLYVLAKRQGVKKAYLAWIPGVWLFVVCKLLGNARIFNQPVQSLAVLMTVVFSIAEFLTFVYSFLLYFPLFDYAIISGQTLYIGTKGQFSELVGYMSLDNGLGVYVQKQINPFGMGVATLSKILTILDYVSALFDLASIFITISLYFALFRKYWPQHYMLASLLSIFLGLFPIFMFVIRKKNPIDYNAYLRARYGAYQNPYGNPYSGYGSPYGTQGGYSRPQEPDSPFEEFDKKKNKKPEEPFEEFEENKNKKPKDPFEEFDNK